MTRARLAMAWDDASDRDGWGRSGPGPLFLLVALLWWAWSIVGLFAGPVWLAARLAHVDLDQDAWPSGD